LHAVEASIKELAGKYVTLAVDSGTIWHRYLTVVALVAGHPPLLIAATPSKSIGDGRLTAVNVANYLRSVVARLTAVGATIVAIVADNASNLQAALRLVCNCKSVAVTFLVMHAERTGQMNVAGEVLGRVSAGP
jgi:Cys-tRNA synthase (O-phospho-L-seryl-tRNA:Cys-tRNA synthase)